MKAKSLFIYSLFIIISMLICFGFSTKYRVYAVNGDNTIDDNTTLDNNNNGTVDPNLNDDNNNNDIINDDNNDNNYNNDINDDNNGINNGDNNDELDTTDDDNDLASNLLYGGGGIVLGALITYFTMKDRH